MAVVFVARQHGFWEPNWLVFVDLSEQSWDGPLQRHSKWMDKQVWEHVMQETVFANVFCVAQFN